MPSVNPDADSAGGGDQKVRDFLSCVLQYMSSRQQGQNSEQANGQRVSESSGMELNALQIGFMDNGYVVKLAVWSLITWSQLESYTIELS